MKYFNIPFVLVILLLFSCKNEKKVATQDPIPLENSFMLGTWKNKLSQSADFKLEKDSVIFLQENPNIRYKYDLTADSLIFHFPKFNYGFRLYCYKGDSIHLDSEMNSNTFIKVK
ncbi:MAG: hypothetical protein ABIO44_10670 [Saprospiraceae bacterium]